jgi:Spy/CpxP family protein refolding chaperone
LVLVFAFTLSAQAQKKRNEKRPELSIEQQTNLAIKQMTLTLDLSEKQQNQITPIMTAQATSKKTAMEKRREMRKNKTKPTADEIYEMKSKFLDNQIAFKNSMKEILNEEQFQKFQKMAKRKMKKGKDMKQKAMMKKRKRIKDEKGQ